MRLGKTRVLLALALVFGASFGLGSFSVRAQEEATATDPTASYEDIVGGIGLIYTGICTTEAPSLANEDDCKCRSEGRCTLDDMFQIFVNISTLILGISGSIVLLMFVYGGFRWVTSQGSAHDVEVGKNTMTHAIIGFTIIITAYSLINFVLASLIGKDFKDDVIQDLRDDAAGTITPPTVTPPTTSP